MSLQDTSKGTKKLLDYRFSLANELTFLSWIRTALALLAGSVAIDQFITQTEFPALKKIVLYLITIYYRLFPF